MSGVFYTFAGAYAISYMTDLIIPAKYRHGVKAVAITAWARHSTQGKISHWLGRQLLRPVVRAGSRALVHPATWIALSIPAIVNISFHHQRHLYGDERPHGYQEIDSITDATRAMMMPIWVEEDHPLVIGEGYWD